MELNDIDNEFLSDANLAVNTLLVEVLLDIRDVLIHIHGVKL